MNLIIKIYCLTKFHNNNLLLEVQLPKLRTSIYQYDKETLYINCRNDTGFHYCRMLKYLNMIGSVQHIILKI